MTARRAILLTPLIGLAFLIGCGPDAEQMKDDAQQALSVGDFSQAREISTRALENVPAADKRALRGLATSLTKVVERVSGDAVRRAIEGRRFRGLIRVLPDRCRTRT